jgi:hypothetical protein
MELKQFAQNFGVDLKTLKDKTPVGVFSSAVNLALTPLGFGKEADTLKAYQAENVILSQIDFNNQTKQIFVASKEAKDLDEMVELIRKLN